MRSAASRAASDAPVDRRGTSQITVAPPRRPASITAPSGAESMSQPSRVPDNTLTPRYRGNASRSDAWFSRPPCKARSGQRRPGWASLPSAKSMPPPHGSASISSAAVAVCASAVANSEAPAPPRPGTTATTAPRRPSSRDDSAASESSATRSPSCAGNVMTCWAPTDIAACHSATSGSVRLTRTTRARRGNARSAQRRAPCAVEQDGHSARPRLAAGRFGCMDDGHTGRRRDAVHVGAQCRITDERQGPVGCGHHPTLRAGAAMAPSLHRELWMNPDLWTEPARKQHSAKGGCVNMSGLRKGLQKGRPPPGGRRRRSSCISPGGSG